MEVSKKKKFSLFNHPPPEESKKPKTVKKKTPTKKNATKTNKKPAQLIKPINDGPKELTSKEEIFVNKYIELNWNGTQAAIESGYSKKTACSIASALLRKVHIKEAIYKAKRALIARSKLTQDMVIEELRKVAFSDIKDFIDIGPNGIKIKDLSDVDTSALSSATMRVGADSFNMDIKMHGKIKSLDLLGQHFGTFNESNKHELDLKGITAFMGYDIAFKKK